MRFLKFIFGMGRGVYRVVSTIFYLAREGSPVVFIAVMFVLGVLGFIYFNAVLMRWIGDLVFVHVEGDFQHISSYGLVYMIPIGFPATYCSVLALSYISDFCENRSKLKARRVNQDRLDKNRRSAKKSKKKKARESIAVEQLPAAPRFGKEERLLCKQIACCGVAAFVVCMPGMRSYTILAKDGVHQQIWYKLDENVVPYSDLRELVSIEHQNSRAKLHDYRLTYLRNGWLETMEISSYTQGALKVLKERSKIEYIDR